MQADEGASDAQVSNGYQIQVTECTHGMVTPSVEQAEQGDTVTLTVKPWGGYSLKSLKAVYTQDGAEKEITISEDNTFTMPDAEVTVTAEFEQTAWLTSIEFAVDQNGTNPVSVELQPGVTDYEVRTNSWDYNWDDEEGKSFFWKLSANKLDSGILIKYPDSDWLNSVHKVTKQNEWESLSSWNFTSPRTFNIKITPENAVNEKQFDSLDAVEYNFKLYQKASLLNIATDSTITPKFDREVFEYTAVVDATATDYSITADGYFDDLYVYNTSLQLYKW